MLKWIHRINLWRARLSFWGLVIAVTLGVTIMAVQGLAALLT